MKAYRIIDPAGLWRNGRLLPKGEVITSSSPTSQIKAWLRFGQVEQVEITEPEKPADKPEASDAAEKLAKEKGIDLALVKGTGAGGNITKGDVEAHIEASK